MSKKERDVGEMEGCKRIGEGKVGGYALIEFD